jgi:hypothetical protein
MAACCDCCKAAEERGELNHNYGDACPYPPCEWHQPEAAEADMTLALQAPGAGEA